MSRKQKLLDRLKSKPKDFTWDELVTLMRQKGYEIVSMKKTGSKRTFFNKKLNRIVHMHEPHPQKVLKSYQIKVALQILK